MKSADIYESPLKQLLFNTLVEAGRLDPKNVGYSTLQTILDMEDSDALKLLKDFGVGPQLVKNMGGIVSLNQMTQPIGYR